MGAEPFVLYASNGGLQGHWLLFLISLLLSAALTWLVGRYVRSRNLAMSAPRERDVHNYPIPRLGGVSIALTFLIVTLGVYIVSPEKLAFYNQHIFFLDRNLLGILLGVILLLGVGIVDDIYGVNPWIKLGFHFLAGIILSWSAVLVPHITNPFGGQIVLGAFAPLLVIFWVVFMINAINWLDGLDGLATGISLIATLVLYILAIKPEVNQLSMSVLALILGGALLGFLPYNFFPAKIFLGDSGSQVLGFLLAVFSIISGGKLATAFLVLGVPILDTLWVIGRRLLTKTPVYRADKFHLHHRLLRAGLSQREAVLLIYTISAAFGIVALQTQSYGKFVALLVLIGMMIVGGGILVMIPTLREKMQKSEIKS